MATGLARSELPAVGSIAGRTRALAHDRFAFDVRYWSKNGPCRSICPRPLLTAQNGQRDDYWEPSWLLRLGGATFRFSSYTALLVSSHVLALLQVLMSREE